MKREGVELCFRGVLCWSAVAVCGPTHRHTHTDRHTHTQTQTHTHRHNIQTHTQTQTQHTDTHTHTQTQHTDTTQTHTDTTRRPGNHRRHSQTSATAAERRISYNAASNTRLPHFHVLNMGQSALFGGNEQDSIERKEVQ
jgi:hypothetical protein